MPTSHKLQIYKKKSMPKNSYTENKRLNTDLQNTIYVDEGVQKDENSNAGQTSVTHTQQDQNPKSTRELG